MADFVVTFWNSLADSSGHDHRCVQRALTVRGAADEQAAIDQAQRMFERLEQMPHWELRARHISCAPAPPQQEQP